ncbi:hypothetical protein JAAARDRAFT_30002 [Jaapia argillacea MUCL 33604]|uniref:Uncharacterized protein n=1 Tax=Jaapia argillacea MUCL 33604 TaxID=933084 RepID=A0A067Q7D9_9AGAM|nr:hypothetical protein JAAARDRAFT_30002 [Jaapia argillacea MUCL 33604]
MLFALTLSYLAGQGVRALPTIITDEPAHTLITNQPRNSFLDNPTDQSRTLWNIIWSCLITVFSCTWVAIHPNVPSPSNSAFRIGLRRVGIMLCALIAPELVIVWAARQWFVARRLASDHQGHGWTQTHGFFALMGGFMLFSSDTNTPIRTLSPAELDELSREGEIDFPSADVLTKQEISDKSKGDILSKTLVVVQTTWFIVQCVARGIEGMRVTELELVALSFTFLNLATYALWWNKPLNVRRSFRVYPKVLPPSKKEEGDWVGEVGDSADFEKKGLRRLTLQSVIPPDNHVDDGLWRESCLFANRVWTEFLSIMKIAYKAGPEYILDAFVYIGIHNPPTLLVDIVTLALLPGIFIVRSLVFLLTPFWQMAYSTWPSDKGKHIRRVPTFYSGRLTRWEETLLIYLSLVIATIFGAIHCMGWIFRFLSVDDPLLSNLWRIFSLTITCLPLLGLCIALVDRSFDWPCWFQFGVDLVELALAFVYVLARVGLIVLAITSVAKPLPEGVYKNVSWTMFIPHVY